MYGVVRKSFQIKFSGTPEFIKKKNSSGGCCRTAHFRRTWSNVTYSNGESERDKNRKRHGADLLKFTIPLQVFEIQCSCSRLKWDVFFEI